MSTAGLFADWDILAAVSPETKDLEEHAEEGKDAESLLVSENMVDRSWTAYKVRKMNASLALFLEQEIPGGALRRQSWRL